MHSFASYYMGLSYGDDNILYPATSSKEAIDKLTIKFGQAAPELDQIECTPLNLAVCNRYAVVCCLPFQKVYPIACHQNLNSARMQSCKASITQSAQTDALQQIQQAGKPYRLFFHWVDGVSRNPTCITTTYGN